MTTILEKLGNRLVNSSATIYKKYQTIYTQCELEFIQVCDKYARENEAVSNLKIASKLDKKLSKIIESFKPIQYSQTELEDKILLLMNFGFDHPDLKSRNIIKGTKNNEFNNAQKIKVLLEKFESLQTHTKLLMDVIMESSSISDNLKKVDELFNSEK